MNRFRTLCVPPLALVLTAALVACGGGGSAPYNPTTSTTCTLPLQYAGGGSSNSGTAITGQTVSSERSFNACNIALLQSAKLTVCIDHPALSEVSGQLRLSGNSIWAFNASAGTAVGSSCLAQSGGATTVREFVVAPANLPNSASIGNAWSVALSDATPTNNQSGYFVAWALELQGLR